MLANSDSWEGCVYERDSWSPSIDSTEKEVGKMSMSFLFWFEKWNKSDEPFFLYIYLIFMSVCFVNRTVAVQQQWQYCKW